MKFCVFFNIDKTTILYTNYAILQKNNNRSGRNKRSLDLRA